MITPQQSGPESSPPEVLGLFRKLSKVVIPMDPAESPEGVNDGNQQPAPGRARRDNPAGA